MAKKKKKSWKKKLLKAALIGGALYGGSKLLGRGRGADAVSTAGQAVGVDRITPPSKWISKTANVVSDAADAADTGSSFDTRFTRGGKGPNQLRLERAALPGAGVIAPPSILNPYDPRAISGRAQRRGGGIAKRGMGAAYKSGGRVTGIAKRGFGRALMKGKK